MTTKRTTIINRCPICDHEEPGIWAALRHAKTTGHGWTPDREAEPSPST